MDAMLSGQRATHGERNGIAEHGGAPGQRFFVNTPATVVPAGNAMAITSSRAR